MLKGISNDICGNGGLQPFTTFENVMENNFLSQDTTKLLLPSHSEPKVNLSRPSLSLPSENRTIKNIDSILAKSEQREQALAKSKKVVVIQPQIEVNPADTISTRPSMEELPFQHPRTFQDQLFADNFLLAIPYKTYSKLLDTLIGNQYVTNVQPVRQTTIIKPPPPKAITGIEGKLKTESSYNWIAGLLLVSLFVFSWMKILYQKYIIQVVVGVVNYQVSQRMLREKNVLFRNMAAGMNLVFSLNLGLFLFFVLQYFGYSQIISTNYFLSIVLYCTLIAIFYTFKTLICKLLGYLFLVQEEFTEYTHNINLFNKNVGLFLFPVVIMLPYVNDSLKTILLYGGILIFLGLFILRTIRGFQIIIRKGVSTFYLILYLCAIEILPVLLLVKYLSTLI